MKPILFELPWLNLPIHGFGLMMVLGFILGIWLARRRAEAIGVDPEIISNLGMICLICGLTGCRAFYVLHNWDDFRQSFEIGLGTGIAHVVNLRSGGLEFFGGLVLTVVVMIAYLTVKRLPMGTLMDLLAPSLALGHALGKVGCFLNGCCYGLYCDPDFPTAARFPKLERTEVVLVEGQPVQRVRSYGSEPFHVDVTRKYLANVPGVPQKSLPVHPTQLYEMAGDVVLVGLLWVYFGYRRRPGESAVMYFLLYAPFRFVLEYTRNEPREWFDGTTTIHQLFSAGIFAVAACVWLWMRLHPTLRPVQNSTLGTGAGG